MVLTFMMHPHLDDKEAIATALCKKAELLGCTGMSRSCGLCMATSLCVLHWEDLVEAYLKYWSQTQQLSLLCARCRHLRIFGFPQIAGYSFSIYPSPQSSLPPIGACADVISARDSPLPLRSFGCEVMSIESAGWLRNLGGHNLEH